MASPVDLVYEDQLTTPADGNRYELLEGTWLVSPSVSPRHQRTVKNPVVALAR
ncbi:MAG: hypothetical protein M0Z54_00695 [Thermaerobacter sp.]|nr:hypothetical protein [Thermaerobacter sp.]